MLPIPSPFRWPQSNPIARDRERPQLLPQMSTSEEWLVHTGVLKLELLYQCAPYFIKMNIISCPLLLRLTKEKCHSKASFICITHLRDLINKALEQHLLKCTTPPRPKSLTSIITIIMPDNVRILINKKRRMQHIQGVGIHKCLQCSNPN